MGVLYQCANQLGETALTLAASNGHHKCVSILVAHVADVDMDLEVTKCMFDAVFVCTVHLKHS